MFSDIIDFLKDRPWIAVIIVTVFVLDGIFNSVQKKKKKAIAALNKDDDYDGDYDDYDDDDDSPLIQSYDIIDPELSHEFSVRANNFWGYQRIIHAIFILAFLFFPVDIGGVDMLFQCFSKIISDPVDEFLKPVPFLALSITVWGLFHLVVGIGTLIKSRDEEFFFSSNDFASFFESCDSSVLSRLFSNLFWVSISGGFWFFCTFMLDISFMDVMIPFITLCSYLLLFSIVEQEIRCSMFTTALDEYELEECDDDLSAPSARAASFKAAFFLLIVLIAMLCLVKFVF